MYTHDNDADILTKQLASGPKRNLFVMSHYSHLQDLNTFNDGWTKHVAEPP